MMNASNDIANFTFERITKWKTPFSNENSLQALLAFRGDVYRGIDADKLKAKIITPAFKEYLNDQYKVSGILAKKARGLMTRFIIKKRIENPENLKLFSEEGYSYDEKLSSESEWVFTRSRNI